MKTFVKKYSNKTIRDNSIEKFYLKRRRLRSKRDDSSFSSLLNSSPELGCRNDFTTKYIEKKRDNIYPCALLVIIILLICYIAKRFYK